MEATFAEASANDHVARLVAKDFCGGDQMWKMEQVAESETGTAGCGTGTAGPHAASRYCWPRRRQSVSTGRSKTGQQHRHCRRQSVTDSEDETSRAGGRTSRSEDRQMGCLARAHAARFLSFEGRGTDSVFSCPFSGASLVLLLNSDVTRQHWLREVLERRARSP